MLRIFLIALILSIVGCSTATYQVMSVSDITKRTAKNRHVLAETQFEIRGTSTGSSNSPNQMGYWYLNSQANYRSTKSLNILLPSDMVKEIKKMYQVKSVEELEGRTVKVTGLVLPVRLCVTMGCPRNTRYYIQTQMLVEKMENFKLLPGADNKS